MTTSSFAPTRRFLLSGTAAGLVTTGLVGASAGLAQPTPPPVPAGMAAGRSLILGPRPLALAASGAEASALTLSPIVMVAQNTPFDLAIANELPRPATLDLGALNPLSADPLAAFARIVPGETLRRNVTFKSAGTQIYDARLLGGDQPMPMGAIIVGGSNDPAVDSDQILLIEDWRRSADGTLLAPGRPGAIASTVFTINRELSLDILTRQSRRLRLRFINGCHRDAIAFKIEDHEATVIAIDGQPSEPFPARDGRLILAPGTRIDVIVDTLKTSGTRSTILLHDGKSPRPIAHLVYGSPAASVRSRPPLAQLASNGLPERLDLKSALRSDISIGVASGGSNPDWMELAVFEAKRPAPAFTVKRGRTIVLALNNRGAIPATFRLHGHHFRLLDRLDDGWKPFWQDRLLFQPGETHRIAFQPNDAGGFLLEAMAAEWSAPKLIRWFRVE